jgi:DNA-damage-inducible protein D
MVGIHMNVEKWEYNKFEDIKHFDDNCNGHWLVRELQTNLASTGRERFRDAVYRAAVSCKPNEQGSKYHFPGVGKMMSMWDQGERT